MKLRIHNNSIRLRLTRSEVGRFASDGAVESVFEFGSDPSQRLRYALETGRGPSLIVQIGEGAIMIQVPVSIARRWCESEEVAISGRRELGGGKQLDILIEKEFRRLHGAKFDPDLFPNPLEPKSVQR